MNTVVVAFANMDGSKRPEQALRQLGIEGEEANDGAAPPSAYPDDGAAPAPPERRVYKADVHEDCTYTAWVSKGKYVVVVRIFPQRKFSIGGPVNAADKLKGAFSVQKSPLVKDFSGDSGGQVGLGVCHQSADRLVVAGLGVGDVIGHARQRPD